MEPVDPQRPRLPPALSNGLLHLVEPADAGQAERLRVLDATTGADVWSGLGLVQPAGRLTMPAVRNGTVFTSVTTGSLGGQLRAYDDCGNPDCPPAWSADGPTVANGVATAVVAAGDLVYVASAESGGTTSELRAYAADGCGQPTCDPLAAVSVGGVATELAVVDGKVFVASSTGVHAFGLPVT